jgi:hypothetical protein
MEASDAVMKDFSFLRFVTVLVPAVFGVVLLAASAFSHSSLDGTLGAALLITAFFLIGVWFVLR